MDLKAIKKYRNKTVKQLLSIATRKFNKYIRNRDIDEPCISCKRYVKLEAGHYYAAGKCSALKYNEMNVNGQCKQCNWHLHANLAEYRKGLIKKIGEDKVKKLDYISDVYKRTHFKWDKLVLIEIITKY